MEPKILGFHHVALKVKDFDKSIKLYTEVLGCKILTAWGEGDGRAIMLDLGNGDCLEIFAGRNYEPVESVFTHIAFRTNDCKGMTEKIRNAGYEITTEPISLTIEGEPVKIPITISFFKGPDGELLEFFQLN